MLDHESSIQKGFHFDFKILKCILMNQEERKIYHQSYSLQSLHNILLKKNHHLKHQATINASFIKGIDQQLDYYQEQRHIKKISLIIKQLERQKTISSYKKHTKTSGVEKEWKKEKKAMRVQQYMRIFNVEENEYQLSEVGNDEDLSMLSQAFAKTLNLDQLPFQEMSRDEVLQPISLKNKQSFFYYLRSENQLKMHSKKEGFTLFEMACNKSEVLMDRDATTKQKQCFENHLFLIQRQFNPKQLPLQDLIMDDSFLVENTLKLIEFDPKVKSNHFFDQRFIVNQQRLWEKVYFMIRSLSTSAKNLQVLLEEYNQVEFCKYLQARLSGKSGSYTPNSELLSKDHYYREIINILQNQPISTGVYCNQLYSDSLNRYWLIYFLIYLKLKYKKDISEELQEIQQECQIFIDNVLDIQTHSTQADKPTSSVGVESYVLFKQMELIEFEKKKGKISEWHYLMLLMIMSQIEGSKKCSQQFKDSSVINKLLDSFSRCLVPMLQESQPSIKLICTIVLDIVFILNSEQKQLNSQILKIMTLNQKLFEKIFESQSFQSQLFQILSWNHHLIKSIISEGVKKFKNYHFLFSNLFKIYLETDKFQEVTIERSIIRRKTLSKQKQIKKRRNYLSEGVKIIQFEDVLDDFGKFDAEKAKMKYELFQIGLLTLIELNLCLFEGSIAKNHDYESMVDLAFQYNRFLIKNCFQEETQWELINKITLMNPQQEFHLKQTIEQQKDNIAFTFNLIKLDFGIKNLEFEACVQVLNDLLPFPDGPTSLEICEHHLKKVYPNPQHLMLAYADQAVQAISIICSNRPKLAAKNRIAILRVVIDIKRVLAYLKSHNYLMQICCDLSSELNKIVETTYSC